MIEYSEIKKRYRTLKFHTTTTLTNSGSVGEDIRKRIFKHIANIPYVYKQSSYENYILARRALIEGDLRVSVSLLYYSMHRAITSVQYKILKQEFFQKGAYEDWFQELGHFTDVIFYKDYSFIENFITDFNEAKSHKKDTKEIRRILCKSCRIVVNPYRISAIILNSIEFPDIDK